MASKINLFPVGNGDMTLIETESGRKLLIDLNIRVAADDKEDDTPDVASMLRKRLERDSKGRLYIDALLLSHPDQDHCAGLRNHFHLGAPEDWVKEDDKIIIRELWSSPMVFRRATKNNRLCEDAKAFNSEARRRVKAFRDSHGIVEEGNRILILGEDEDGKTDDLKGILIKVNDVFSRINGREDSKIKVRLLAPLPKSDNEEILAKNHSSVILQITLAGGRNENSCRFLTGGDAGVAIWEKLGKSHSSNLDSLSYDVLQAPHHSSWHSLSYDSWSEMREDAKVCADARKALAQARPGAIIVASSKAIKNDDNDPPCIRAKREYESILNSVRGDFICVGEHPSEEAPGVLEIAINEIGPRMIIPRMASAAVSVGLVGRQPLAHG